MVEKKPKETQAEQSQRFREAVQEMIDAGELNPIEADEAFDKLLRNSVKPRASSLP